MTRKTFLKALFSGSALAYIGAKSSISLANSALPEQKLSPAPTGSVYLIKRFANKNNPESFNHDEFQEAIATWMDLKKFKQYSTHLLEKKKILSIERVKNKDNFTFQIHFESKATLDKWLRFSKSLVDEEKMLKSPYVALNIVLDPTHHEFDLLNV